MDDYVIKIHPKAIRDIDDIYAYIFSEKESPIAAKRLTDKIWEKISLLKFFPEAHQDFFS